VLKVIIFLFVLNNFLYYYQTERAPEWLKENKDLKSILMTKLNKNKNSKKLHNYIIKPWAFNLKLEFISWEQMERSCDEVIKNVNVDEINVVVGITTGGSFIGAYVAKQLNKPFEIITSKLWSEISFKENFIKASSFYLGYNLEPVVKNIPNVKDKRVLLVDDTTYTGVTFSGVQRVLENVANAKSVKTLCLWRHGEFQPTYHYGEKRIPFLWEWGSEVD
jgi:hypoxanthine phosphoribosyltransferase